MCSKIDHWTYYLDYHMILKFLVSKILRCDQFLLFYCCATVSIDTVLHFLFTVI